MINITAIHSKDDKGGSLAELYVTLIRENTRGTSYENDWALK